MSWGAVKSVEEGVRKTKNTRLGAHLFASTSCVNAKYGTRISELRRQWKIRDAVAWAKLSMISRPPSRWLDLFVKSLNDRFDALRVPRASSANWSMMARDRDEWGRYWRPLEQIDDHRDDGRCRGL
ncbi:unnamed protein product [Nippostrongylus brasiliensis]|uniref:Transposase n=1 Tax=Nippostrongylus brasiliensis TaxID=27835 RepID=A0A0N4YHR4_NIPBR|nr:unnamed protein product [Nippostrongylus brasiliensis]